MKCSQCLLSNKWALWNWPLVSALKTLWGVEDLKVNTTKSGIWVNQNFDEIQMIFFCWITVIYPKIYMEFQRILSSQNKVGCLTLPDLKTYEKAIAIKIVWYWHKDRYIDQWNTVKSPDINPHIHGYIIFDKGAKTIQWKRTFLSANDAEIIGKTHTERVKLGLCLTSYMKLNSKWIKNLNVKS